MVDAAERGCGDDASGPHTSHHLAEFVLSVDGNHRAADGPGGPDPVRRHQAFPPVGELPHDDVPWSDSLGPEIAPETSGPVDELIPGQADIVVEHRWQPTEFPLIAEHQGTRRHR